MKTSGYGLYPHALISLPAFGDGDVVRAAGSPRCGAQVQPERNSRALLERMALHVPDDISAKIATGAPDASFAAAVRAVAPPFVTSNSVDDASRAAECLTTAVYYEARSQSEDGQRAVAQVVLNRVRDRAFPNSVCRVVYQGGGAADRVPVQLYVRWFDEPCAGVGGLGSRTCGCSGSAW